MFKGTPCGKGNSALNQSVSIHLQCFQSVGWFNKNNRKSETHRGKKSLLTLVEPNQRKI